MSSPRTFAAVVAVAVLAACGPDVLSAPLIAATKPNGTVYPAWAYKPVVLIPGQYSLAADVNDRNEIVGYVNGEAFFMRLWGSHHTLAHPGSTGANAGVINTVSAIGGAVIQGGVYYPAYWRDPYASPIQLPRNGSVLDMNDRSEAVGWMMMRGVSRAYYWETASGLVTPLPRYGTGNDDVAWAINNDRTVVGTSAGSPVMWRQINGAWTVTLLQGIFPTDVDAGYGTVGSNGNGRAVFGKPSASGVFATTWLSSAWAVNNRGEAVGEDWDTSTNRVFPWVGDRGGRFTYLPFPSGSAYTQASARGINTCGLVVGFLGNTVAGEAVAWDPGC